MDSKLADVTFSVVVPTMEPEVAVICTVPAATPVAKPCEPWMLLIVAIEVLSDAQVTLAVRTCVLLSA